MAFTGFVFDSGYEVVSVTVAVDSLVLVKYPEIFHGPCICLARPSMLVPKAFSDIELNL